MACLRILNRECSKEIMSPHPRVTPKQRLGPPAEVLQRGFCCAEGLLLCRGQEKVSPCTEVPTDSAFGAPAPFHRALPQHQAAKQLS
jgi:hypothetical protein